MDENADGGTVVSVATANSTSVTVDDERFEVDGGNLKLKAGTTLDFESDSSPVDVVITASGDGASATHTVSVSIGDVNEGPSLEVTDGAVDENAAGAMVGAVTVSDPDADDTQTYSVSDERFEVADGMLKLKDGMSLDHETEDSVTVTVTVTDAGGLSASADATVAVNDMNEEPTIDVRDNEVVPVKDVNTSLTIDENTVHDGVGGAPLALIEVMDPDAADATIGADGQALVTLSDTDNFQVILDPEDGLWLALTADTTFDFEADGGEIMVTVTYTDTAGNVASMDVTVTVNDVNEAPSISVADGTTPDGMTAASTIDENSAGVPVGEIMPSDPDGGDSYTFEVSDHRFETKQDDVGGWWLKLKDGMSLDHEAEDSVTVTVTITDAAGLSASTDVTVTVSNVDEAPSAPMVRDAALSVNENDAGVTLSSLADSTDPEGDAISYSVDDERFEITSGLILKLKDGMSLDHEAATSVDLVITASDPAGNSSDTTVTVDIGNVNEAPEISVAAGSLAENEAGADAAAVTATDADADDTHTYEVSDNRFEVANGMLKLKDGVTLDHEEADSVTMTVTVTDAAGLSASADATVTVADVNEAPELTVGAPSPVGENTAGADVAAVTATDVDAGDTHTYEVSDSRFEVANGMLKLKDGMSLDFETDPTVALTVTVTDAAGLSASADVTVTVGTVNEAPELTVGAPSPVSEDTAGADVAAVSVADADAGDTHTYEVNDSRFEVANGMLKLKDGESLDYETESSVALFVTATDAGGLSDTVGVTVTVSNANEAPELAEDGEVADAVFEGGEEYSMTVDLKALFSDPDGDALTFRLSDNVPSWLTFSTTTSGSGADQTIMGTISGTPPADMTGSIDGVSIIAMDAGGMSAEVTFDIVVDAENAAPSRLDLRVTEEDGVVVRVTAVEVEENAEGAVLGTVRVNDEDDARHPHGQHDYTFEVDGKADDRFEVTADGQLKLKDDASLDHEDYDETDGEITLKITATDRQVTAPAEGEDPTTGSASQSIKITVKDIAAGDGPVALKTIGDWWVTVDDDLDEEDVRDGDWLSFGLDTTGDDAAFTDEDGDDLTYTITAESADGTVVDWLQISDSGKITNKAEMLPERGVYTVTVTATDEGDNSARTSFQLAVALSDEKDRDNDTPDIRDVEEFDYTEGSGSQKVASFSVRDDDVAIAPHPYGVLEVDFTAKQGSANVKNRLKVVEVGRDEDSVHYEIHTKSAAELFGEERQGHV